ncbi:hypothetical protein EOK76_g0307 [Lacticaseibacillus paracasei]|nr:hypothetical protein EOK76_g0307 [Lacticaseibacillus paracasei]
MADHKLTGLNGCGDKSKQIFTKKTTPCFTGMGRFFLVKVPIMIQKFGMSRCFWRWKR